MWLSNKIINDCILGLIDSTKYHYLHYPEHYTKRISLRLGNNIVLAIVDLLYGPNYR